MSAVVDTAQCAEAYVGVTRPGTAVICGQIADEECTCEPVNIAPRSEVWARGGGGCASGPGSGPGGDTDAVACPTA